MKLEVQDMFNLPDCMYDYRMGGEEDDRKKIGHCCECDAPLFEGMTAYYVLGSYWCEDCMENCKEEL